MIYDALNTFGTAFSLAAVQSTLLFTNQIDLGVAGRDPGNGEPVYVVIVITTAVTGTSSTVNFRVRSDDSASIHATTSSAHGETGAMAEALLVAGFRVILPLFPAGVVYERYLGLQAIIGTATTTAGAATAFLTRDVGAAWKAYADASN